MTQMSSPSTASMQDMLTSFFWSGDAIRSRRVSDIVLSDTLDVPVPSSRLLAQDPSNALTVVAVHTGPEGGSILAGTVNNPLTGAHGTLTLHTDGSYTYQVDQTDPAVQALATSAETITDKFNYTIQDTGGLQDTATLTITIHGADDLPLAVADTGTMTQNDAPTSFNVIANDTQDPDHTALNTIAVGPGSITVTGPAGETFVNTDATATIVGNQVQVSLVNADFQQLALGEHATVTVPYTLTGDTGETSSANLVVTVNGVNDVPVAVNDTGTITEDQVGTFSVLANDTLDADHGAPNNVTTGAVANLSAPAGEGITTPDIGVSVNGSNQVVVTLGANFQHMQDGQTATFDVPYTLHGDQAGDTSTATLHVTVNGVNDAPTITALTFNGTSSAIYNTDLVVHDPGDTAPDPAGPQRTVTLTGGLLNGTSDVDGPNALTVVAESVATSDGGHVTVLANGDFTYTPKVGTTATTDTFTYTVTDGNAGASGPGNTVGTATIALTAPHVWYVNADAVTDGDGSSEHPFNTLTHFAGVGGVDGTGDTIVLETASAHYTGGLTLENNEQLISQSAGVTIDGTTLFTASGANAVLDGGLVLASGNTIEGVDFGTTGGFAVSGSSVGTLHLDDTTSGLINNASGGGISIGGSSNVLNVDLSSITSGGGTNGISLTNSSGTFHAHGGTISNASGADVALNGGTVAFTDDGAINDTTGTAVSVANMTGGTDAFTGAITGGSIALSSNTGATINFSGGMNLSTGTSNAFSATGGGTINITGTNHLTTTTGTALTVVNTNIGSSGITFHDISANGGTNGIVLNNTGTAASNGGLTVTGDGSTPGSGGTIQNTVQGALFTSTKDVSLSFMNFTNPDSGNGTVNNVDNSTFNSAAQAGINLSNVSTVTFDHLNVNGNGGTGGAQVGINGQNVSNLTISNSTVTGFGDAPGEGDVKLFDLSGTSAVTNSTFGFVPGDATGGENLFEVRNDTGTLTLNVTGSTFHNTRDSANGSGGIAVTSTGTAVINLNASNDTFSNLKTSGIEGFAKQTSTLNVNITDGGTIGNGNTFDPGSGTGRAIGLSAQDTADLNFNINRNVAIKGNGGPVIDIASIGAAVVNGRIDNNTDIENNANQPGSPVFLNIQDNSTAVVDITGNTINNAGSDAAISAGVHGDGISKFSAALDVTIASNTINLTGQNLNASTFNNAILLSSGADNNDATTLTADLNHNTVTGVTAADGNAALAIENTGGGSSHLYLQGFTTDAATTWDSRFNTPTTGNQAGAVVELDNTPPAPLPSGVPVGHNGGNTKTPSNPTALFAAASGVAASSPTSGEMHLTQAELNAVVAAAIANWASAGLSPDKIAALHQITYDIADITSGWLGESTPGHVTIDVNADGHGWFVDPTPQNNSEFAHAASATDLLADPSADPAGHMDLLTTVMHEMGEQLGLEDKFAPTDQGSLMYAFLGTGERVLADAAEAAQANAIPQQNMNGGGIDRTSGDAGAVHKSPWDPPSSTPAMAAAPLSARRVRTISCLPMSTFTGRRRRSPRS